MANTSYHTEDSITEHGVRHCFDDGTYEISMLVTVEECYDLLYSEFHKYTQI